LKFATFSNDLLNIVAKWLALLHILEFVGSNLDLETSYPDRLFMLILSLQANVEVVS
jgi:hypothetical protein